MLERIGFRYVSRVDPFDGGPHYEASLAEVSLVRAHRHVRLARGAGADGEGQECLVGVGRPEGRGRFRAVRTWVREEGALVRIPEESRELLRVRAGDRVHVVPFV
jgi:arginine N-succinyltransferase